MPARRSLQSQSRPAGSTLMEVFAAADALTERAAPDEVSVPMTFSLSITESVRDLVRAAIRNAAPRCPVCMGLEQHSPGCTLPRLVAHMDHLRLMQPSAPVQPGEEE